MGRRWWRQDSRVEDAGMKFGTKAETLEAIYGCQEKLGAKVLPVFYFTTAQWQGNSGHIWEKCRNRFPDMEDGGGDCKEQRDI